MVGGTVNDREVVQAEVFAFVLPHFLTKVNISSVYTLRRFLAIEYKRFQNFWRSVKQSTNIFREGSRFLPSTGKWSTLGALASSCRRPCKSGQVAHSGRMKVVSIGSFWLDGSCLSCGIAS